MSDSGSSGLSEAPPSPEPAKATLILKNGKLTAGAGKSASKNKHLPPPRVLSPTPPREPSPDREPEFFDHPDIAVLVMFRSRFDDAFTRDVPNLGPQDFERGLDASRPSEQMENYLCALIGLALNRKKPVERGRHSRALEEAIAQFKNQWPHLWQGVNPLYGPKTFDTMDRAERLSLLKALMHWSLNSSETISAMIKDSYRQVRHEDDLNQPLSVQPWGQDTVKRRYWLVEGRTDTAFRIYRESDRKARQNKWRSIAGSIEEAQNIARDLRAEKGQAAHRLAGRITAAVAQLEINEEKRRRKEYRQQRKAQFSRPPVGFSMYEGRTRGKRMNYNFDDQVDDEDSEASGFAARRSTRQPRNATPDDGPTMTASGRQVRSTFGRTYGSRLDPSNARGGSSAPSDGRDEAASDDPDHSLRTNGRLKRSANAAFGASSRAGRHLSDYNDVDEMEDEEEAASSGDAWDGDDDDVTGKYDGEDDEDDQMSENGSADSLLDETERSLVVKLKYRKGPNGNAVPVQTLQQPPRGSHKPASPSPLPTQQTPLTHATSPGGPPLSTLGDNALQANGTPTPSTAQANGISTKITTSASSSDLAVPAHVAPLVPSSNASSIPITEQPPTKPLTHPNPTTSTETPHTNGILQPRNSAAPPTTTTLKALDPDPDLKVSPPEEHQPILRQSENAKPQHLPNPGALSNGTLDPYPVLDSEPPSTNGRLAAASANVPVALAGHAERSGNGAGADGRGSVDDST
ncbi:MAG: hypothetical protein M1828_004909 [Chrysothrix sp. TS-e1954]|nr:MAG: hypothetical protein M1828_004909 [Chrysothrix sp. TS-e1954]